VSADYRDGMLEVTIRGGSADHPEPRRIEIRPSYEPG
jgi:HSP20 family molecular chaperone IbpA